MKNPLNRRLPREFKGEMGKYMVIFLFMIMTIGFTSGYFVANSSMLQASDESYDKYNIEDGKFETEEKIYKNQ
jgi:putative ABC transport system permease protein